MTTLDDISVEDESWDRARQLAFKHLSYASLTWRLIRNGWSGSIDEKEFVKLFNFTHLSPSCLIRASDTPEEEVQTAEDLQHSVQNLGIPFASVVVAINLSCSSAVMKNPGPIWKKTCQELMTYVEIGCRFGARVPELGPAVGGLAGFALACGSLAVLNEDVKHLREWLSSALPKPSSLQSVGAEISQISGFMIQHLGFGHEAALGAAFGSGSYTKAPLEFSDQTLTWIAACRWIESLRHSRNYPRDVKLRSIFPNITPPPVGSVSRNQSLEALYIDIASVVKEGSKWTWHLPRASYEETEKLLAQQTRAKK